MTDPEQTSGASESPSQGSASGCEALQKQINTLVIALIVLSGTFAVFLWRQTRYLRSDLNAMKNVATPMIQGYNQEKPVVDAFIAKVAEYSRSHPDFAPIAQKYQLQNVTNLPSAGSATNRPAPAPAPKK